MSDPTSEQNPDTIEEIQKDIVTLNDRARRIREDADWREDSTLEGKLEKVTTALTTALAQLNTIIHEKSQKNS